MFSLLNLPWILDLNLDQVEFSALPSGLHLVEQDVVCVSQNIYSILSPWSITSDSLIPFFRYFTKDEQQGVCIFRRRKTTERGHRGFRLSSLGILLAKSRRSRAWRHVKALKELTSRIYSQLEHTEVLELRDDDWEPARIFFEERKLKRADLGGAGDWTGWSEELDGVGLIVLLYHPNFSSVCHSKAFAEPIDSNPTLHLPHLLRILGPSSLTLYKHILGRKRVLIYTLPPVEVACILCQVAADICFDSQNDPDDGDIPIRKLKGRHRFPVDILGMVTLTDVGRLELASQSGRGWVACKSSFIYQTEVLVLTRLEQARLMRFSWKSHLIMIYSLILRLQPQTKLHGLLFTHRNLYFRLNQGVLEGRLTVSRRYDLLGVT